MSSHTGGVRTSTLDINATHRRRAASRLRQVPPVRAAAPRLPRENVYGHTKKVELLREALTRLRQARGRGLRVLDVGCGNGGAVTQYLAAPEDNVCGVDFHEPSIEFARARFARPGLTFTAGSIDALSETGAYDAVVFADVLEHVEAPLFFLESAHRLLKADGRVLVTIPNGRGPYEMESAFSRRRYIGAASLKLTDLIVAVLNKFVFRHAWSRVAAADAVPYNHESGHVQFYTFDGFVALAAAAGFTLCGARNLSTLSGPYTNYFMAPSRAFCRLNNWTADRMARPLVSAWFLEFKRGE